VASSSANPDNAVPKLLITLGLFAVLVAAFWLTAAVHPTADGTTASVNANDGVKLKTEESVSTDLDRDMPAMKLFNAGKTPAAVAAARNLIKKDSNNASNLVCAGNILAANPDTRAEGLVLLQKSVYSVPDSKWVGINFARKLAVDERNTDALAQYDELTKKYIDWPTPRYEMAQLLIKNHEFEKASKILQPARTHDASNNRAQKQWGLVEALTNLETDDGWAEFKHAVYRERKVGYPGEIETLLQRTSSDTDKALADLRAQLARRPDDLLLKLQAVQVLIAAKKLAEAKTALDALARANPKDPDVQLEISELALWNHDELAAKKAFDQGVKFTDGSTTE